MNVERLLAHYEKIADAPDAVARLRRFILDLAVRGKLVPQDSRDEPASELLKRIAAEKARLVKTGQIRDKPALASVSDSETPFVVPATWQWVRLANIVDFSAGRTPSRNDASFWNNGDHAWVSIADMKDGQVLTATKETVSDKARERVFGSEPEAPGAILMSFKLTIGKIARLGIPAFHNEAIISIRPHLAELDPFLFKVLPQFARQGETKGAIKGATLNRDSISNILFPLPPLSEQHRIVAKVDELMALCDRLESVRAEREATRDRLAAASLARLEAPDPETFQDDARFVLDALPALTTRPDQIKALRQTILNLAVRGKLVPQDASDEPASELLKSIGADVNARKSDSEHDLPTSWAWALIEDCFVISGGMQKTPARTPKANAFPYLGVGNVYRGRLELVNVKKFELVAGELERFRLEPRDILVVEGNGSASEIGRCAIWNGEIENCVHQNHIIRCRPKAPEFTGYAALYLNSPDGMAEMKRLAITSAGLFSLSVGKIRKIPFPLPPLAEQHRIVAKIDSLMALCDRLEASLTATAATRRRLLDALLAEALAPTEEREEAA
jgi:type I restriction enzyme, S subunit